MQGHEAADIDPWEDPSFDIYHTTDRYGFIQYVLKYFMVIVSKLYVISWQLSLSITVTLC